CDQPLRSILHSSRVFKLNFSTHTSATLAALAHSKIANLSPQSINNFVDYTLFNNTYEVDTPLCSAKQLDELRAELNSPNGLERLCSSGLLPRVSSAASLDPASEESGDSGRLQIRSCSVPNGIPVAEALHHKINGQKKTQSGRRLSIKQEALPTLLFSRNAVICHRDGIPCLMFRVGDMRKSHIIEAHVRAQIIRKKVTKENEVLPFYQQELEVGADGKEDRLMFIWPTTIVHKIDKHSPLYALSAQDMLKERFEIVVMLEGVVESTGMTTQARSSYLPSEILWGHRFEQQRWLMLIFALSFLLSWTAFGIIWWLIAYTHGDLDALEPQDPHVRLIHNKSTNPCVTEIYGFTSCFLFSVETQHTIGYGNRYITEECPEAIFIMCLQSIMGVFIQAFMVGIVFAKLSRPKKRAQLFTLHVISNL
uniref:G protein-activated inward rectifier potassium channel 3 n=1 Tax=Phlebotomus papatasi TaxID=29031 RepID=A0A1B0D4Y4_PHLPP